MYYSSKIGLGKEQLSKEPRLRALFIMAAAFFSNASTYADLHII
jgi:hypothetical protein